MSLKIIKESDKDKFEKEVNKELSKNPTAKVQFKVIKNFLPLTNMAEYEEYYYAFIY